MILKCIYVGSWTCPTDEEQYKCHVLPVRLASMMPIKQYLVQLREDTGLWHTVATRSFVQRGSDAINLLNYSGDTDSRRSIAWRI